MNKKVVLVIDDEDTMRDLIKRNLYKINVPVIVYEASTGEEGVEKYRKLMEKGTKPDLVIMDLNLTQWGVGKIDGVEATRQILSIDPEANIYGYTAWFATAWANKLLEAGAKDVIERTILPGDFRKMMESILTATDKKKEEGP
ncbi:MAG: response regulator transcription factor [Thermoplasmata archaeon]|nr:response regulator transcription factor [Thermoplasmata archaeon]